VARQTRERLLQKARVVLVTGEKPTVAQFAEAAGVSRASVYRTFGSHGAVLDALELQPEPGARDRILDAALAMVGASGLGALSMDELAIRAGVSRATLYRLFPGKSVLFMTLIRTYSPLEPVSRLAITLKDEPPEILMPEIARTIYRTVHGSGEPRIGMLRAVFFEVSSLTPDAEEATREALQTILGSVGAYVMGQMSSGRLRQMSPLLALQSFIGPIFFHVLTRPVVERVLGMDIDGEQAVTELALGWMRSMQPDEESR
jgi:AcrR family transcriptional regulator